METKVCLLRRARPCGRYTYIFYMQAITRAKQIFRSRSGNDTKGLKAIIEDPDFSVLNVSYAQRFFTGT